MINKAQIEATRAAMKYIEDNLQAEWGKYFSENGQSTMNCLYKGTSSGRRCAVGMLLSKEGMQFVLDHDLNSTRVGILWARVESDTDKTPEFLLREEFQNVPLDFLAYIQRTFDDAITRRSFDFLKQEMEAVFEDIERKMSDSLVLAYVAAPIAPKPWFSQGKVYRVLGIDYVALATILDDTMVERKVILENSEGLMCDHLHDLAAWRPCDKEGVFL